MNQHISDDKNRLDELCRTVRQLVGRQNFSKCEKLIFEAMRKYPHAPEPHNLIGVVFEKKGDHVSAMKHFRAAWSLDPTYIPARHNLDLYGTFDVKGKCAFDESDCLADEEKGNRKMSGVDSKNEESSL